MRSTGKREYLCGTKYIFRFCVALNYFVVTIALRTSRIWVDSEECLTPGRDRLDSLGDPSVGPTRGASVAGSVLTSHR